MWNLVPYAISECRLTLAALSCSLLDLGRFILLQPQPNMLSEIALVLIPKAFSVLTYCLTNMLNLTFGLFVQVCKLSQAKQTYVRRKLLLDPAFSLLYFNTIANWLYTWLGHVALGSFSSNLLAQYEPPNANSGHQMHWPCKNSFTGFLFNKSQLETLKSQMETAVSSSSWS